MGKLTNLNPPAPIADGDLPASIARDLEITAALDAHIATPNPHPGTQQTTGGLLSTTGTAQPLATPAASSRVGWGISDGNPFIFWINQFAPVGGKIFDIILDKLGNVYARRLNDSYSPGSSQDFLGIDAQGNIELSKNLKINGFLKFGSGSGIKLTTLSGVTNASSDTYTAYPHGLLDVAKIIFVSAIVYPGTLAMPPNTPVSNCNFSIYCHGANLILYLPPVSSGNILNKRFVATILYAE
jgi:hypothetical protein